MVQPNLVGNLDDRGPWKRHIITDSQKPPLPYRPDHDILVDLQLSGWPKDTQQQCYCSQNHREDHRQPLVRRSVSELGQQRLEPEPEG